MGTKWKNSLLLIASVFFCLGGWYLASLSFSRVENARFDTADKNQLSYLLLESIYAKEIITDFKGTDPKNITFDQIEAYRYEYGDLGNQVSSIQAQYQGKIEATQEEKAKEVLVAERDKKIKAILDNFTDDEVVKEKIIKEEKDYIAKNKKRLIKDIEPNIQIGNENYFYYFKDGNSNITYTNVASLNSFSSDAEVKKELKSLGYGEVKNEEHSVLLDSFVSEQTLFYNFGTTLEGNYIVKKDSNIAENIKKNNSDQVLFGKLVYLGLFVILIGIIVLYVYINSSSRYEKLKKIPIDMLLLLFLWLGFVSATQIFYIYPYNQGMTTNIRKLTIPIVVGTITLAISFVALKLLWWKLLPKYREQTFKELLKQSFCFKIYQKGLIIFRKLPTILKIVMIGLIVVANLFILLLYRNAYYFQGYVQPILSLLLLCFVMTEIWIVFRYLKRIYQLLKIPKSILKKYNEGVSDDFSLVEIDRELLALDELVRLSQKDTMQSEMLKTELLTNVSHDLRTPLTSIITYGDLLTQPNITKEEQTKYIEIINKKSLRMKHLIDDLFEVTKMNNGEIILEKHEVNLGNLLQQAVSERSEEFKEHKLKMVFNKPEEDIVLPLDGERMWRVFDNMFGNVLKYAMPDTRVYLKLETINNQIKIELKNISRHELNEDAEELVEKFKRGDSSRHTEGSGLGLAIINSIVSLHEGTLEIIVDGDMFKLVICL